MKHGARSGRTKPATARHSTTATHLAADACVQSCSLQGMKNMCRQHCSQTAVLLEVLQLLIVNGHDVQRLIAGQCFGRLCHKAQLWMLPLLLLLLLVLLLELAQYLLQALA
jgi:hypothetical protein